MQKSEHARRVPAKAAIESVINIVSLIIGLLDALYTLIMKIFSPTTA